MNYPSVVRVLSLLILLVAALAGMTGGVAAALNEWSQATAFLLTALACGTAAATIGLLAGKPRRRAAPADGLAVSILWIALSPVAASIPFVLGVENSSVLTAIHEAASCLSTSGHTVITLRSDNWPVSLLVWRALLHLLGAASALVIAAGVFAAINLGGPGIHRSVLFSLPDASFFEAIPRIIRAVLAMLVFGFSVIFISLVMAGEPIGIAAANTVSAITTGLVLPSGLYSPPNSPVVSVILTAGLAFAALGLAAFLPLGRRQLRVLVTDPEVVAFAGLASLFALLLLFAGINLTDGLGWSVSTLATSGIPVSPGAADAVVPVTVWVIPCLIGGAALSAAGGVKLARLIVLFRRAEQEFRQLGYRRSMLHFSFRDRVLDERSVIGVWVYLIAYIVAVFVTVLLFSLSGQGFEQSIRLSIGALTSSGGLIGEAARGLRPSAEALLIVAMLLGRLEILALLPAMNPSFWRR